MSCIVFRHCRFHKSIGWLSYKNKQNRYYPTYAVLSEYLDQYFFFPERTKKTGKSRKHSRFGVRFPPSQKDARLRKKRAKLFNFSTWRGEGGEKRDKTHRYFRLETGLSNVLMKFWTASPIRRGSYSTSYATEWGKCLYTDHTYQLDWLRQGDFVSTITISRQPGRSIWQTRQGHLETALLPRLRHFTPLEEG